MSCLWREYIYHIRSRGVLHLHHVCTCTDQWKTILLQKVCDSLNPSEAIATISTLNILLALANWHLLHLNEWTSMILTAWLMTYTPLQGHMGLDSWLIRWTVFQPKTWLLCSQKSNDQQNRWAAKQYNTDILNVTEDHASIKTQAGTAGLVRKAELAYISLLSHAA